MSEFESTLREILAAGHTARFRAAGDSMYPTIRDGDYLHVVRREATELRRGDIVLAAAERGLTAHRIVRINRCEGALRITTRGDNALRSDRAIEATDVLGRVEQIERAGIAAISAGEAAPMLRFVIVVARRLRGWFPIRRRGGDRASLLARLSTEPQIQRGSDS